MRRLWKTARRHVERLSRKDRRAALQFLGLLAVLPVFPNRELDWLLDLNPRVIWLVVVFIAGMSLAGYGLSRFLSPRKAMGITGFLGGFVSPSLTVAALAEQHQRNPRFTLAFSFSAAVAATVLFPRVFVLVWIVSWSLARSVALPLGGMTAAGIAVTGGLWFRIRGVEPPEIDMEAPFRIAPALGIGGVVAGILACINYFEISLPSPMAETGIVLALVGNLLALVIIAGIGGSKGMAGVLAVVTAACSLVGLVLVWLV